MYSVHVCYVCVCVCVFNCDWCVLVLNDRVVLIVNYSISYRCSNSKYSLNVYICGDNPALTYREHLSPGQAPGVDLEVSAPG